MLLPKPKKRSKRKYRRPMYMRFADRVIELDRQCMNPDCPGKKNKQLRRRKAAHHIKLLSQGSNSEVEDGITFCAICHDYSHGCGNLTDKDGDRITGLQFILGVLDYWKDKPEYRWHEVHEYLRRKANV